MNISLSLECSLTFIKVETDLIKHYNIFLLGALFLMRCRRVVMAKHNRQPVSSLVGRSAESYDGSSKEKTDVKVGRLVISSVGWSVYRAPGRRSVGRSVSRSISRSDSHVSQSVSQSVSPSISPSSLINILVLNSWMFSRCMVLEVIV